MLSGQVTYVNAVDGRHICWLSALYHQAALSIFRGADACAERLTTSPSTGGDSLAGVAAGRGRSGRSRPHVPEVAP